MALLRVVRFLRRQAASERGSIFAPSLLAIAGFRCVSMNIPSAPAASPDFAIVEMSPGSPPLTPSAPFGCCSE